MGDSNSFQKHVRETWRSNPLDKNAEDILCPVIDQINTKLLNARHLISSGSAYLDRKHWDEVCDGIAELTWCSQELVRLKRMIHNHQI
jgi:hypothetical protein